MNTIDMLDRFLTEESSREKKSHWASDVSSCRRQQWYRWRGEEKTNPPTPGQLLKMQMGNAIERIYEDMLDWAVETSAEFDDGRVLASYEKQVRFSAEVEGLEYPISGKIDYVLRFSDGTSLAVELKSGYGRGIAEIQSSGKPKPDYLKQIFIYTQLTEYKEFQHPYLGRDNGYRTEFFVRRVSEGLEVDGKRLFTLDFSQAVARLQDVESALRDGREPDRDFLVAIKDGEIKDRGFQHKNVQYKGDWQCSYCSWRDRCWREIVEEYPRGTNNADMFEEAGRGPEGGEGED